jgi:hypothetical protein
MAPKKLTHPGWLKKLDQSIEQSFKALVLRPYIRDQWGKRVTGAKERRNTGRES